MGLARRVLGAVGRTADESGEVRRLRELVASLERIIAARDLEIERLRERIEAVEQPVAREPASRAEPEPEPEPEPGPEPEPELRTDPPPRPPEPASPPEVTTAAPTPRRRSLSEAIRASGTLETGASFRLAPPGTDTSEELQTAGTADVVLGEQYDTEVRTGPDGPYWGPVDNDSARSRARGENLDIDRKACIGCGTCVENIDSVFYLNDDEGKAYVIRQEGSMDRIQDAIDACPVTCIHWS